MGWTETYVGRGAKVNRKKEVEDSFDLKNFEVVKSAMVGSTYYGAIRNKAKGNVFAIVVLTSMRKGWFGTKMMDESSGPCYYDCPKAILDLLSPTESEWANEWRAKCKENMTKPKLSELPIGTVIKFKRFDGKEVRVFKHKPAYQFKRPFWMFTDERKYLSAKYIPNDFEVETMLVVR